MTEHKRIEGSTIVETLHALPERITLSTGQTITGFNTLSAAVLKSLGYLPVFRDSFNNETHSLMSTPEITADAVIYHAIPRDIDALKDQAKQHIDMIAGETRARFIPQGQMQEQEYLLAQKQALAFKQDGYPGDDIPQSIVVSMTIRNKTAQQEADAILAEGAMLENVLIAIRQIRLAAKSAIDSITTDHAQVIIERDLAISELNGL